MLMSRVLFTNNVSKQVQMWFGCSVAIFNHAVLSFHVQCALLLVPGEPRFSMHQKPKVALLSRGIYTCDWSGVSYGVISWLYIVCSGGIISCLVTKYTTFGMYFFGLVHCYRIRNRLISDMVAHTTTLLHLFSPHSAIWHNWTVISATVI